MHTYIQLVLLSLLKSLTKADNAERISTYPRGPSCGIPQCLRSRHLLTITHHVCQPVRPTIQVQYQTHCGVGHFFYAIARYVADSNTCSTARSPINLSTWAAVLQFFKVPAQMTQANFRTFCGLFGTTNPRKS